jgi:negative regulator of sigma E activity
MDHARRDSGGIVIGWLVKLAVVTTVVAIVAFDAISVGVSRLNGTDDANSAALAAAQAWQQTHNVQAAVDAAAASVTTAHEVLVPHSLRIDADGTVHLELRRQARTLVMYRIGPLRDYTFATVKGESGPPTS